MPDITNVLSAIGQETRLDILKLLSDALEAGLASVSIAIVLDERREPADIADVFALRLVADPWRICRAKKALRRTGTGLLAIACIRA